MQYQDRVVIIITSIIIIIIIIDVKSRLAKDTHTHDMTQI